MQNKPFSQIYKFIRPRLIYAFGAILTVITLGAICFHLIEGYSLLDSFYFATETVTTVGYGDYTPKTVPGRLFAIFFMLIGGGTVLYALTSLVQSIVQSEILSAAATRRKKKEMDKLNNHFIVCGSGRVGRRIIRTLENQKIPFVVVESDERRLAELIERGCLTITGDATLEENLRKAGVERAKGLASCLPDDADNVYVVLTARGLNENLHIVARAVEEEAEPKLIRAGANRVVAPTIIGSQSMARALIKPAIADFMDSIVAETLDLAFEEVPVTSDSIYKNKRIKETDIRSELDLIVIAIRRKSGEMLFQPDAETVILEGDLLITIGRIESIARLVQTKH